VTPAFERVAKRAFDIVVAGTLLVLTLPLLVVVALAVRILLGAPVVFRQQRPGRYGKPFDMMKFRSMSNGRDANGVLLPDAQRLTPFGLWLRRTSIDELPELWCVLRGSMSLVGPRPLLMEYLPLYSSEQARRHAMRPGITGWAQVNGRNALSWEEKFELDIWYVEHQSLALDLRILLMTLGALVRHDDVSAPGEATMPKFTGTRRERVS
jgi:lipopolysaccharide/colanic/teichoic acid biosynthesis glycosyltransferase